MKSSEDYCEKIEVRVDLDFRDVQDYILGAGYEGILHHQIRCPSELDVSFPSPYPVAKFDWEEPEISG